MRALCGSILILAAAVIFAAAWIGRAIETAEGLRTGRSQTSPADAIPYILAIAVGGCGVRVLFQGLRGGDGRSHAVPEPEAGRTRDLETGIKPPAASP